MVLAIFVLTRSAQAVVANWSSSDLDVWLYGNAPSGTRATMPSFSGGLEVNESTGQFVPKGNRDTARQGMALLAFNTAPSIQTGLPAESYQVSSVTLTIGLEAIGADPLLYCDTPVPNAEILAGVASGQVSTAMPFELYGVGFRSGYTGFGFGPLTAGPPLFEESNSPYNSSGYVVYPVASVGNEYVDVSNSLTGGFSATAPGNVTSPFDPVPWAIGQGALNPGDEVNDDDEFTFSLDLAAPGVAQYIQTALTKGELGFFLSSFHITGEFGVGGAYPSWYSKEAPLGGDAPPRLEIEYSIVEPSDGDFDDDGDVDGGDFLVWQSSLGPSPNGFGADGNGDGTVDGQDLGVWEQGFGGGGATVYVNAIPEPSAALLGILSAAMAILVRGRPIERQELPRDVV
jgi:hypothetical protein